MKIITDILKSRLITDNPEILRALHDKYGFLVPGYNYVPSYKKRQWDGKKRYFKSDGTFRTGLLPRIIKDLNEIGCDDCNYYVGHFSDYYTEVLPVKSFKYRDYQEEAILEACKVERLLLDSPTGSGKTLIMAGILKTLGAEDKKAIILFREKGILNQTYKFFQKCGLKNLGINSGDGQILGNIMLSTVQSLGKIVEEYIDSDILMVDEVHQFCKGEVVTAAIEAFPKAKYRLGFTATIPSVKSDIHGRLTLEGAFGQVYTTRSMEDLIKDGKLAKPIIQIVNYSPSSPIDGLTYQEMYEEFIVESEERNSIISKIVSRIKDSNPDSKILILVKNLKHVENLSNLIEGSLSIEGKDSIDIRYDIINEFIAQKHSVMIGTNVMQTGISVDEITHMINARGLEGEIPTVQGLGRGVRKAKGKNEIYFYDFYDTMKLSDGRPGYLEKHSKKRIAHYNKLNLELNYVKLK